MGAEPVTNDHVENLENNNPVAMNPMIDHGQQQQQYGNMNAQIQYTNVPHSTYDQYVYQEMKPMYMPEHGHEDGNEVEYVQLFDPGAMYGNVHSSQHDPHDSSRSPPPPPRIYKPCVVCNDKSSGYHYGVSSCEGCKGFFRRSVQKNMQYTCHKEKNCIINKVTRNRCQYCRLQKCFQMGMSKEAVRNDRHKKKKQKGDEAALSPDEVTEPEQSLIEKIKEAHESTYPVLIETESSISNVTEIKKEVNGNSDDDLLWERIGELSSSGIVKIVEFAKKLPGFRKLSTGDQITLLKAACLEVMILRLCTRYDLEQDALVYETGNVFREQLQTGGFGPLANTIFNFAASLKTMEVDSTEFSLLCAICLTSGDRSGLEHVEDIEKMQEPILEALKHYVRSRRKDQPQTFAKLLMKITDLRSISVKGAERVLHLRMEMSDKLQPLVLEMLDRQENVCIP